MSPDVRRSKSTLRIEELLLRAGNWTPEEYAEVQRIIGPQPEEDETMSKDPDDYPTEERRQARKSFEIQGDWREPTERPLQLDASPPARPDLALGVMTPSEPGSLEERVSSLERTVNLLWKAIHQIEQRLGVGKDDGGT